MIAGGVRQLPGGALRSISAAALLGVAAAWLAHFILDLDVSYVARTAALLCIGAALLLRGLPVHHPFDRFGLANQITLGRGVLIMLLAGLIGMDASTRLQFVALGTALLGAVLDAADGPVARRTRMSSTFGARFDMETDALLILVLSILVWQFDKAGAWVIGSGLMRYAFVGAALVFPCLGQPLPPSSRRKTLAVIQTASLLVAVAPFVSPVASGPLCAVALCLLAWSFLADVAWLRRRANSVAAR